MTFKKADMAKTLKIRFSMIETNPLNHKWLDFVILTGLALHQFQTNWLLSENCAYRIAAYPNSTNYYLVFSDPATPRFLRQCTHLFG